LRYGVAGESTLQSSWERVAWLALGGLLTLSYGFNNVQVPVPGLPVPLVDVLLVALLLGSRKHWTGFAQNAGREITGALCLLLALGLFRLTIDVPRHGALALRDALFVLEAFGLLLGVAMAQRLSREACERIVRALFMLATGWLALYPVRDAIQAASPVVGVQKAVPLLSFTSAGIVAALALLWFLDESSPRFRVFTVVAVGVVLLAQMRGVYLAIPIALVVRGLLGRAKRGTSAGVVLGRAIAPALVMLAIFSVVPLPGRLGVAGPELVVEQLSTLRGEKGAGSGSLEAREEWWPRVIERVQREPAGQVIGVGFGPDLLAGYEGPDGSKIRKPHNDFLEIWARTGWLGLAVWLLLLGRIVRALLCVARAGDRIAIWALSMQPVFVIVALSQPLFAFAYGGLVYFVLCGLALAPSVDRGSVENADPVREVGA
jgi:O-antigen ligase